MSPGTKSSRQRPNGRSWVAMPATVLAPAASSRATLEASVGQRAARLDAVVVLQRHAHRPATVTLDPRERVLLGGPRLLGDVAQRTQPQAAPQRPRTEPQRHVRQPAQRN